MPGSGNTVSRLLRVGVALGLAFAVDVAGQTHDGEASATATGAGSRVKENVWVGVFTNPQAQRGRTAYLARCASCHTEHLTGRPPAPALVGAGFVSRWDGKTVRDFYGRIRTTMPTDLPGSLSRGDTLDIVAYLFQANGFPAGVEELAGSAVALQQTKITQYEEGRDGR